MDQQVWDFINKETMRQREHLELIASENYTSKAVMEAQGSILTNKYAEGYPGRRYYGGCEYVDEIEQLAIDRLKTIFGAKYANVQPHSGSQANAAVFLALLQPNDVILGMDLNSGGHLTHGATVNFSGQVYRSIAYGIKNYNEIDYDQVRDLALKFKPKMIIAGYSSFCGLIDWSIFRAIADEVGAYLLVDMAHIAGLVASDLYPNPVPHAHVVTSTTHKTLRGPRGGVILSADDSLGKRLNSAVFPGTQGGPLMHVIAAKAIAFAQVQTDGFRKYSAQVISNARALMQACREKGCEILGDQTHNHMFMMKVTSHGINGKEAQDALGHANITVNKNSIVADPLSPMKTSGLRIGTPAVTTRGFSDREMQHIASWIANVLQNPKTENLHRVRQEVQELCRTFPLFNEAI